MFKHYLYFRFSIPGGKIDNYLLPGGVGIIPFRSPDELVIDPDLTVVEITERIVPAPEDKRCIIKGREVEGLGEETRTARICMIGKHHCSPHSCSRLCVRWWCCRG